MPGMSDHSLSVLAALASSDSELDGPLADAATASPSAAVAPHVPGSAGPARPLPDAVGSFWPVALCDNQAPPGLQLLHRRSGHGRPPVVYWMHLWQSQSTAPIWMRCLAGCWMFCLRPVLAHTALCQAATTPCRQRWQRLHMRR